MNEESESLTEADHEVNPVDAHDSADRVEDMAFQNRVKALTEQRKWNELRAVLMVYGSALSERETRT